MYKGVRGCNALRASSLAAHHVFERRLKQLVLQELLLVAALARGRRACVVPLRPRRNRLRNCLSRLVWEHALLNAVRRRGLGRTRLVLKHALLNALWGRGLGRTRRWRGTCVSLRCMLQLRPRWCRGRATGPYDCEGRIDSRCASRGAHDTDCIGAQPRERARCTSQRLHAGACARTCTGGSDV